MIYRGITYDTGDNYPPGSSSLPVFDPALVRREMEIIRSELHCNAIRITGCEIDRLVSASRFARETGMTVFFSPRKINASPDETAEFLLRSAGAAEQLRAGYGGIVLVAGSRLSLLSRGFVTGDTPGERSGRLFDPVSLFLNASGTPRRYNRQLDVFLRTILPGIRDKFRGGLTYAAGTWEQVDWNLFDLVGTGLHRSSGNRATFRNELQNLFRWEKPVIVLEVGCGGCRGAEDRGAAGRLNTEAGAEKPKDSVPDESVQADYIRDLLEIVTKEGVSGAFVSSFLPATNFPGEDPDYDRDTAGSGIVTMLKPGSMRPYRDMPWVPRKAFGVLAGLYACPERDRSGELRASPGSSASTASTVDSRLPCTVTARPALPQHAGSTGSRDRSPSRPPA